MLKFKFEKLFQDALGVCQRFPLAVLSSLILTIIAYDPSRLPATWKKEHLIMNFILSTFLFIALKLLAESRKWNVWFTIGGSLVSSGIMSVYLYHLPIPVVACIFPFFNLALGLILLVMIVPLLRGDATRQNFWTFNYQIWSHAIFTGLTCLVLGAGVGALLFSMEYLLNFKLFYEQYYKLQITLLCFVFPLLIMGGIPSRFDETPSAEQGKGIQLLLNYVLSPILIVYGLIIIFYAIQTLFLQTLPRGKASNLVALLGVFGSLTYILGDREDPLVSKIHHYFRKHFFHIMLIPLILMGFALGTRIHQYGLTAKRYDFLLLFIWFTGCVFYSIAFSREKLSRFMIVSASSLLILGSFGPWGVLELSARSQMMRLHTLLEKHKILENNKVQKTHRRILPQDEIEISLILNYIVSLGKKNDLKILFGPEGQRKIDASDSVHALEAELAKEMGIKFRYSFEQKVSTNEFSFRKSGDIDNWTFVDGFDYLFNSLELKIDENAYLIKHVDEIKIPRFQKTEFTLKFERSEQNLTLKQKGSVKTLLTVDIGEVARKLKDEKDPSVIDRALTFEGSDGDLKARIVLKSLFGKMSDYGTPRVTRFSGYLLIKKVPQIS